MNTLQLRRILRSCLCCCNLIQTDTVGPAKRTENISFWISDNYTTAPTDVMQDRAERVHAHART